MYERITDENPYKVPMRIYPAVHYTMGGLWVDYNLMSNLPGLFVLGEANFSDHGANRLGASALMQGLADGYFVLPYTIGDYLAPLLGTAAGADRRPRVHGGRARRSPTRSRRLLSINGNASRSTTIHRELGKVLWDNCGMARSRAEPRRRRSPRSPRIREEFWKNVACSARTRRCNQSLEKAGRVADFLEFGELHRASTRCTATRAAAATSARSTRPRTARRCATTSTSRTSRAWEFKGVGTEPELHKEPLEFEYVHPSTRSYK